MKQTIIIVALAVIFGSMAHAEDITLIVNRDVKIASGQRSFQIAEYTGLGAAETFRTCQVNFIPMNFKRTIKKGEEFLFDTNTAHAVTIDPLTKVKLEFQYQFGMNVPKDIESLEQFRAWIISLGPEIRPKKNWPGQAIPGLAFSLTSKKTGNVLSVRCMTGKSVSVNDAISMMISKNLGFFTPSESF